MCVSKDPRGQIQRMRNKHRLAWNVIPFNDIPLAFQKLRNNGTKHLQRTTDRLPNVGIPQRLRELLMTNHHFNFKACINSNIRVWFGQRDNDVMPSLSQSSTDCDHGIHIAA
jgi:hypothetical protein